ncbi:MAG: ferrous iron transport protein B [Actinobacteria bacterium]|nr:ferrous iron transport protein B [Actinomycetota bacterium]
MRQENLTQETKGLKKKKLLLVGHANVGKSVIFSELTGKYVDVSNYPGTTVEISRGKFNGFELIDTPGISGVIPRSEDEKITFNFLANATPDDVLIQVCDAKNLKRSLLVTLTLAEARMPIVLDLNMFDEAEARGYRIDIERLSEILGIPVTRTVAVEGKGIEDLKNLIESAKKPSLSPVYNPLIENAIKEISSILSDIFGDRTRFVAVMLLSSNLAFVDEFLFDVDRAKRRAIKDIILKTQSQLSEPLSLVIIQTKSELAEKIFNEVVQIEKQGVLRQFRLGINDPAFHPVFGYFILAAVLFLMYQFVGKFAAGVVVDFFETKIFGQFLLPWLKKLLEGIPYPFFRDLLVGEYGLISMGLTYAFAIVFPIVTSFFIVFSILEDSGYLPRLGVLLNSTFEKIGLNGKAVVPMVLGLGCGTMATIVTRILETRRERIIATLLLALGIPCSAQLGVILGLFSAIGFKAFVLFLIVVGLQLALVGYLSSRIIPGKKSAFLAELPPYRMPALKNIYLKTLHRTKWFLKEAVPLFIIGTFILFTADKLGLLPLFTKAASPIVTGWLNLPEKAAESLVLGFLRRDYGTAGLFVLFEKGMMDKLQAFVSMVVITLFVPCIANFLVIVKERGVKVALAITLFVFSYAFFAGGIVNFLLRLFNVSF